MRFDIKLVPMARGKVCGTAHNSALRDFLVQLPAAHIAPSCMQRPFSKKSSAPGVKRVLMYSV